ncbi:MAG TPA: ubiquitin [Firmicutes bacterium]|nr:ubiquitin [Bacillota bacterium]
MDKLEKIERLRERAQVSYDEAREAFDQANGDLLDALILLEKQGKVRPPKGDGYYRSEQQTVTEQVIGKEEEPSEGRRKSTEEEPNNFKETLDRIVKFLGGLIRKGNTTNFEILKEKEHMASFPVTVLALLLLFAPWVTLPLIVIGLFFGFHYQFVSNDN